MLRIAPLILAVALLVSCRTAAPDRAPLYDVTPAVETARGLMAREDITRAFAHVDAAREQIVEEWRALNELAAPSGHEAARAGRVVELLRAGGARVDRDEVGNVIVTRPGSGGGPVVVFDAHLDTVFGAGTDLETRIENGRIHGPGVGDNTRNVVALLAMLRAMDAAEVRTEGDVIFLFTVEEETNFRGINHFLEQRRERIDRFVALDGGYGSFTYGGIGIHWDRYHILGAGGHTLAAVPPYSAALPLARAIARIYEIPLAEGSRVNVGMLGGAEVFNAKAADAWMSVDARSTDGPALLALDAKIEAIVNEEAARAGMSVRRETVSRSSPAMLPGHRTSPMIQAAEGVWRAFGFNPAITNTASNHAAVALRAGVPAISTGTAPCRDAHSVSESCEIDPIFTGIKRNIVLAVALSAR